MNAYEDIDRYSMMMNILCTMNKKINTFAFLIIFLRGKLIVFTGIIFFFISYLIVLESAGINLLNAKTTQATNNHGIKH